MDALVPWLLTTLLIVQSCTQQSFTVDRTGTHNSPALLSAGLPGGSRDHRVPEVFSIPQGGVQQGEVADGSLKQRRRKKTNVHQNLHLSLQPGFMQAPHKAQLLIKSGRIPEAECHLEQALKIEPNSDKIHTSLGWVRQRIGNVGSARQHFASALQLNPQNVGAHVNLASLLEEMDNIAESAASFNAALHLQPQMGEVHGDIGRLQAKRGDISAAVESYKSAVRLLPNFPQLLADAAGVFQLHGDLAAAEKHYYAALHYGLQGFQASNVRRRIGVLLALRGALQDGRGMLKQAAEKLLNAGVSPASLVMNLEQLGEDGYISALSRESKTFREVCRDAANSGNSDALQLPGALSSVRRMENDASWIAEWHLDCLKTFGIAGDGAAYGAIWFESWREVALLRKAKETSPLASSSISRGISGDQPAVLVIGSALGEQCLFAVALGARCVGYDVLCKSLVVPAQQLVKKFGLKQWIRFHCKDGATASHLESFSMVWLNDYMWSSRTSKRLQLHLASKLRWEHSMS